MNIDQIAVAALQLPPKQRALLAESLWNSLADPYTYPIEIEETNAIILAHERDEQIESGVIQPLIITGLRQ
jgi:hypothetical protein